MTAEQQPPPTLDTINAHMRKHMGPVDRVDQFAHRVEGGDIPDTLPTYFYFAHTPIIGLSDQEREVAEMRMRSRYAHSWHDHSYNNVLMVQGDLVCLKFEY